MKTSEFVFEINWPLPLLLPATLLSEKVPTSDKAPPPFFWPFFSGFGMCINCTTLVSKCMMRHNSISHFKKDEINPTAKYQRRKLSAVCKIFFCFLLWKISAIYFRFWVRTVFCRFTTALCFNLESLVKSQVSSKRNTYRTYISTSFAALIVVIYLGIRCALIHIFVFLMRYLLNIN